MAPDPDRMPVIVAPEDYCAGSITMHGPMRLSAPFPALRRMAARTGVSHAVNQPGKDAPRSSRRRQRPLQHDLL